MCTSASLNLKTLSTVVSLGVFFKENLFWSLPVKANLRNLGLRLLVSLAKVDILLICQVVEDIVSVFSLRSVAVDSKYQVDPLIQL